MERIREAAHEVQRPVFYAIGIIITAYLPIFTLQRVEGRLFKPMAWTVAFALLGALIFSMLIAPVLSSFFFRKGAKEWHNPVMMFLTDVYRVALEMGHPIIAALPVGVASSALGCCRRSLAQRRDRFRVSAAPRRRRDLGSRHPRAQHRPHRRHRVS